MPFLSKLSRDNGTVYVLTLIVHIFLLQPLEKANASPENQVSTTLEIKQTFKKNDIAPSDYNSSNPQSFKEVDALNPFYISGVPLETAISSSKPSLDTGNDVSEIKPLSKIFRFQAQENSVTPSAKSASLLEKPSFLIEQLLSQATQPQSPQPDERLPNFGKAGQKYWYVQGAGAVSFDDEDFDNQDESAVFGLIGVGISQFFATGHSINAELNTLGFIQPNEDALGLNLSVLYRWHFYRQPSWSLYIDGGAGILGTTSKVPSLGSQFNFTPQLGGGATFSLRGREQLMLGVRWHHISNANLYDSNPGRDSIMLYGAWIIPR